MEIKSCLLFLALLSTINLFGQINECNSSLITMSIMDSCIYYDCSQDAAPIRIGLNNSFESSRFLVGFRKCVSIDPFLCDEYTVEEYKSGNRSNGLVYFIEDEDGKILQCNHVLPNYINDNSDESLRCLDTLSLRLNNSDCEHFDNGLFECPQGDSVFGAYLIIAFNYDLHPGHYKLFLAYSYNGKDSVHYNVWPSRLFVGSMISNDVDLIVKAPHRKWWQFWKKK